MTAVVWRLSCYYRRCDHVTISGAVPPHRRSARVSTRSRLLRIVLKSYTCRPSIPNTRIVVITIRRSAASDRRGPRRGSMLSQTASWHLQIVTGKPSLEVAPTACAQRTRQTEKMRAAVTYLRLQIQKRQMHSSRLAACTHSWKCFSFSKLSPNHDTDTRKSPR